MRAFVWKALEKLSKLDKTQIELLLHAMAQENERLSIVLDSLQDGVLVADELHNLVLANKASERLVPLAAGRAGTERRIWSAIGDREVAQFVRASLENDESVADREFAIEHGGIARIISCSITPLVKEGEIQGSILKIMDISEKRAREARLRRAEGLASLTTLAAGVAHEIKNPLGSIGIHNQLVRKLVADLDAEQAGRIVDYVSVIDEEIDRLNKIVIDFLFAVRPMDTHLEAGDLNELLRELLRFVHFELEQNDIEIVDELNSDIPALDLDQKFLKQAILNLVKNAISAMPSGGILRMSTQLRGDQVLLRISDNGIGMSSTVRDKIFEPYFTTKDFGSGIGLTLVYKVVKEHMGEISVISKEGRGSTFTISLPVPQREKRLLEWEGGA